MRQNILFFLLFSFLINAGNSQVAASYLVKINDKRFIPEVSHNMNGGRIAFSNTSNKSLNTLLNSYEIYSCRRVFKSSNRVSLQNFYLIDSNDEQLFFELEENYSQYYSNIFNDNGETLVLPNDFGFNGGYVGTDQEELNYIRAQEAWDITTGSSSIIIGISDNNIQTSHEDLVNQAIHVYGNNYPNSTNSQHGSWVASFAAADTNNNKGLSSIGYQSTIYSATNNWATGVDTLSNMLGVKVINTAWINSAPTLQTIINETVEDRGVVVVGSAGNGQGGASSFIYPAAFKNVISVSGIGHQNETYGTAEVSLDHHEYLDNGVIRSFQHNDSVDIVAPSYGLSFLDPLSGENAYRDNGRGTSFSSPMVSGTIALMFDVNYCIDPKEVESILKLTAVKIDTLPQNLLYYGKLGAGKLDAYEAVKMAKDMADTFGTVEVKNRILYRPWFYKLETAPYEIKMINNDVTGGSKLKFRARNNIEILSGDYYPQTDGYIDLSVDDTLALDCTLPPENATRNSFKTEGLGSKESTILVSPTLVDNDLKVSNLGATDQKLVSIKIYDFYNLEVYSKDGIKTNSINLNLERLKEGIYILQVINQNNEHLHVQKIVKK